MIAFNKPAIGGFFSRIFKDKRNRVAESRRARKFANDVYNKTGGPTPLAKRLYADLLASERRPAR